LKIKILTEQLDNDENKLDEVLFLSEATIKKEDNVLIIDYKEDCDSPEGAIITRIRATDKKLIMTKIGMLSSTLEFEVGKKCKSIYSTAYGNFKMVINTKSYEYSINENNTGSINLKYLIRIGDSESYINRLSINLYG
jgi:uncharacterized beta-barrel protein YwiB (DUF1934 family)